MQVCIPNILVSGVASCVPKEIFYLSSLSKQFGEREIERIIKSTGIHSVRIAQTGTKTSELCEVACKSLLKKMNVDSACIDGIIFVSQTPDKRMPATSVILQSRLGFSKDCVALDINYGCSGYIYGLYVASSLIHSGGCKKIILCAGDVLSPHVNTEDKAVRMLFGDGASATLIEMDENHKNKIHFILKSDGSGAEFLKLDHGDKNYLFMDGYKIMEFALREVPPAIDSILNFAKWNKSDVDNFVFHQANMFILNYLKNKMEIDIDVMPFAIDGIGNTSSASIPIVLCENHDRLRKNNKLNKVIMCGFGVGLSWGSCALNLQRCKILPLLEY